MKKKLIATLLTLGILCCTQIGVDAAEQKFSKAYVDSNSYSAIASAYKDTDGDYGSLKITDIYKANGSSSDYQCVYCRTADLNSEKLVYKGSWYELQLPSYLRVKGKTVYLYVKGHNPKLDCRVSGYWNVH